MPLIHISRRERFSASHRLSRPDWSEEKNFQVFGKCANPNGHGHNYDLWVTVKGQPNPETSFVIDLSELGRIIKEQVIQYVDHKNLDLDVPFMKGKYSSTENLAIAIWEQLEAPVTAMGATLHCVKLLETENNHVEYYGGKG
jgi:6-pyruvoyltetrahydropterin/6-carboxytetrahydropterin synthase